MSDLPAIGVIQAISLVVAVTFLSYVTAIVIPYFKRKRDEPGDATSFAWHMFVPCRDEAAVIGQTLNRLTQTFPESHVWVVDDDSEDATAEIVDEFAAANKRVHLVRRVRPNARTGKGDALNAAYRQLSEYLSADTDRARVIVCVVDADGQLDPNALMLMAGHRVFGDASVGAAQTSVIMRNRDDECPLPTRGRSANGWARFLVRMQDLEFRTTIAAMQMLRERTNSVGLGGNGQFTRLSVLDVIRESFGEPWHGALLEDYELGIHVLLTGCRNRYVHDSWVSQEGLVSLRALLRQRTRWSQGNMQCVAYLKQIVTSRRFSDAGALEASYFLLLPFLQVAGIIIWPTVLYTAMHSLFAGVHGLGEALIAAWWFLTLLILFGLGPYVLWGPVYRYKCEPRFSWTRSLIWGLGYYFFIYYMYVSTTRGLLNIIRGRTGWAKTRRNAELAGSYTPVPLPRAEQREDRHV